MSGPLRRPMAPGPREAIWVAGGIGSVLCLVTLLLPWGSVFQARMAASSIGIITVALAQLRPRGLWQDLGSTQAWRILFGDQGTVWLLTLIGISIALASWFVHVG